MLAVIAEEPDNVTIGQPREADQPFEKDIEELAELIGREAAISEDPLGPHLLPEPPRAPRSPTPEYIPLSPRGNGDELEEDPEEEPVDIMATDPPIILDLPNQCFFTYEEAEDLTAMSVEARDLLAIAYDAYHYRRPWTTHPSTDQPPY
ncbi:hypothetical protein RJT34_19972 [Clitoria ternatea]|uniref:Uncharacterized protein n=1 Tax=Clitoria ternatea TaxID=43366 RepID=A0AAN9IS12_CLITE